MIIDANRDLYVTRLHRPDPIELATVVQSARWHATVPVLAAISSQQLIVWYYPHVVYVDNDLVSKTRTVRDAADLGKDCTIIDFYGARCSVQKADGTQQVVPAAHDEVPSARTFCRRSMRTHTLLSSCVRRTQS